MFSDQYDFFIDDFEKKLTLIQNEEEIKLIKGDLKNLINDLFADLGKTINIREIEERLSNLQKVDISAISEAVSLFDRKKFYDRTFTFNDSKTLKFIDALNELKKSVQTIKEHEVQLGTVEILLRIELFIDGAFQRLIYILDNQAPTKELLKSILAKLNILSESDLKIIWSRIKGEFRDSAEEREVYFEYDKDVLGKDFFEIQNTKELKEKIAAYVTVFRPKIISKRIKQGKTSCPILSLGIAKILSFHKGYVEDLTFSELALIKIINRILEFWDKVYHEEKNSLCALLGVSSEGRIASLKLRDIDRSFDDSWFDFARNKIKGHKLILCELRRLLSIVNYYITRQTNLEKALFQYKLGYEIYSYDNYRKFMRRNRPNELSLQKELCKFLLERDIYSYGKKFGSSERDLIVQQPKKIFIIETKIYKTGSLNTLGKRIKGDFVQLGGYLDQELDSALGILVIYNLTGVLIEVPRIWIKNRFWVLPINISRLTPSKKKQSIRIEESRDENLIRCLVIDGDE